MHTGFGKDDPRIRDATLTALLGGSATGGLLGGVAGLLSPKNLSAKGISTKALLGALTGGAIAGGSTYVGNKVMGVPRSDDPTGYTTRGAVGGAVGGGSLGAGLGALAARGAIKMPKSAPEFIRAYAQKLKAMPLSKGAGIGAALGALGLGSVAGYYGADEGMQLDFINNQLESEKREKLRREYGIE